jgi:hypothetical protein
MGQAVGGNPEQEAATQRRLVFPVNRAPDFFEVRAEHQQIHERLCNWARVVRVHQSSINAPPMFKQYRSSDTRAEELKIPADLLDGWRLEKAVSHLPDKTRAAVRWSYVHKTNAYREARKLAVSHIGLVDLVHMARTMLKNRC